MTHTNRWLVPLLLVALLLAQPAFAQDGGTAFDGAGGFGSDKDNAGQGNANAGAGGADAGQPDVGPRGSEIQVERFEDWGLRCGEVGNTGEKRCEMFQQVTRGEESEPVMRVVVGYPGRSDDLVAVLQLPLGIILPEGVALRIDDGEPIRFPVQICVPQGCRAEVLIDDAMLGQMKAGSRGYVGVQTPRGNVELPISLMGFTAAFERLSG